MDVKKRVLIIGGGASGLAAAVWAARQGARVTVVEHMDRVGKKILSTGNGRCNMTNLYMGPECYRSGDGSFPMRVIEGFPVFGFHPYFAFHLLGHRRFFRRGYPAVL